MATDMNRLQGEVAENPQVPVFGDGKDAGVEKLLIGFLKAMLDEQRPAREKGAPTSQSASKADQDSVSQIPAYLQIRATPAAKESV